MDAFPVPNQVSQQEVGAELVDQEAKLIDQGLRAKIDLVGITGLQFVELDFFDPQQFPAPPEASDAAVCPSDKSVLSVSLHKGDLRQR